MEHEASPRHEASREMIWFVRAAEDQGWDSYWISPSECEITKKGETKTIREVTKVVIDD
jgi:hypothetical protein